MAFLVPLAEFAAPYAAEATWGLAGASLGYWASGNDSPSTKVLETSTGPSAVTRWTSAGVPLRAGVDPAKYFTDKIIREVPPTDASGDLWARLRTLSLRHPAELIWTALDGVLEGASWVAWNFVDLYDQVTSWDGTLKGLLLNSHLIWRSVVTAGIVAGMVFAAPLLEALYIWMRLLLQFLSGLGTVAADVVNAIWYVVDDVIQFLARLISSRR